MLIRQKALSAIIAAALAAPVANAAITFDPDGPGGDAPISLGTLDWGPTSFVAVGAIPVAVGDTFTVYTHATLIGTLDPNNNVNTPGGLGNKYEITMILGFQETVTAVVGNIATFAITPTAVDFLEVYYDSKINANALDGSGFNDGTLILYGNQLLSSNGLFQTNVTSPVDLDQSSNGNQYPEQLTVTGQGTQGNFSVGNLTWDPKFFLGQILSLGIDYANISQALPFVSVDPSDCFTTAGAGKSAVGTSVAGGGCAVDHVLGPYSAQVSPGSPGYLPVVGNVNGVNGPDFVAQTDFNSPVSGRVPEPATIALMGLGLAGLGFSTRGRRKVQ